VCSTRGGGASEKLVSSENRSNTHVAGPASRFGFTLAEVLITLGIIGVVCAITLPSLISEHREKVTVTRLNSLYSLLSQGFESMVNDYGEISFFGSNAQERVDVLFKRFPEYFKTVKICNHNMSGCIVNHCYRNNSSICGALTANRNYGFILNNGVAIRLVDDGICVQDTSMTKTGEWELGSNTEGVFYGTYHHNCAVIYADINGDAGPNIMDKDTFAFAVVKNGIVPIGGSKERTNYNNLSTCLSGLGAGRCTAWVIYNKNMDYLHCPDKLGWDKASSCKD